LWRYTGGAGEDSVWIWPDTVPHVHDPSDPALGPFTDTSGGVVIDHIICCVGEVDECQDKTWYSTGTFTFLRPLTAAEWEARFPGAGYTAPDPADIPADIGPATIVISHQGGEDRAYLSYIDGALALAWEDITPTFPADPTDAQEYDDDVGTEWTYVEHEGYWVGRQSSRLVNGAVHDYNSKVTVPEGATTVWFEFPDEPDNDVDWHVMLTPTWQTSFWLSDFSRVGVTINVGTAAPYGGDVHVRCQRVVDTYDSE